MSVSFRAETAGSPLSRIRHTDTQYSLQGAREAKGEIPRDYTGGMLGCARLLGSWHRHVENTSQPGSLGQLEVCSSPAESPYCSIQVV